MKIKILNGNLAEYYKGINSFPYEDFPISKENQHVKNSYVNLFSDYATDFDDKLHYIRKLSLFYTQFFKVPNNELSESISSKEVTKLRIVWKKNEKRIFSYKYLFYAHYLLMIPEIILERDYGIYDILEKNGLKLRKKDVLRLVEFTNALKSFDLETANQYLSISGYSELEFFYTAFQQLKQYTESTIKRFLVIGTMSAGKSTILNSILGKDIFPSQNEACTAKVYSYRNRPYLKDFIITKNNKVKFSHQFQLTDQDLQQWNTDDRVESIQLEGNLFEPYHINNQIILTDTPGANNSMNREHSNVTMKALESGEYDSILYIINATQLGTDDDKRLLGLMKENAQKFGKEIIFVVNKIDEIDEDESLEEFTSNTEKYLSTNGVESPKIIYVSALATKLSQMVLSGSELTRKERIQFINYYDYLSESESDLNKFATVKGDFKIDTDTTETIQMGDKQFELSRIYKVLNHSGMNQIISLLHSGE